MSWLKPPHPLMLYVPCRTEPPAGASARAWSSIVGGSSASLPQPKMPGFGGDANGSAPSKAASVSGDGSTATAGPATSVPASSATAATTAVRRLDLATGHLGMGDSPELKRGRAPASRPTLGAPGG